MAVRSPSARRAALRTATLGAACLLAAAAGAGPPADGLAPLEPLIRPGTVLFLGEIHGTFEAPEFAGRVATRAVELGRTVTVGLEIPPSEMPGVSAFLASPGARADREAMLAGRFWSDPYQDGRASEAMADLLERLRELRTAGHDLRVVLFDRGRGAPGGREHGMAEALVEAISERPGDVTVVLTGNLHARLSGGAGGASDPMAAQVARRLPEARTVALALAHAGGTAWICGSHIPGGCGIGRLSGRDPSPEPRLTLAERAGYDGFHGTFHVGPVHAALPASDRALAAQATISSEPSPNEPVAPPGSPSASADERLASRPERQSPLRSAGDWPQWMGPRGLGGVDLDLTPDGRASLELDWRRPIGEGRSALTVHGERVLTLEAEDDEVYAVAFDARDGRRLWRSPLSDPTVVADRTSQGPLSTPATDGERVFAIHPAGRLVALALADGTTLWSRDLVREHGATVSSYGIATSPVLGGDAERPALYVGVGGIGSRGGEGAGLLILDPKSGAVLRAVGPAAPTAFATPVVGDLLGRRQVVVPGDRNLFGVDPAAGAVLWSYPREGDDVRLPYPDRSPLLLSEGRVFLPFQEYGAMFQVDPGRSEVRELWRARDLRGSYSPAVHHRGAIFGLSAGRLVCLDAAGGGTLWSQALGRGTLVRVGDDLVVFDAGRGELRLVAASPEGYREVAPPLKLFASGSSLTAPSFGAGRIFVRADREIAAVRIGRRQRPAGEKVRL